MLKKNYVLFVIFSSLLFIPFPLLYFYLFEFPFFYSSTLFKWSTSIIITLFLTYAHHNYQTISDEYGEEYIPFKFNDIKQMMYRLLNRIFEKTPAYERVEFNPHIANNTTSSFNQNQRMQPTLFIGPPFPASMINHPKDKKSFKYDYWSFIFMPSALIISLILFLLSFDLLWVYSGVRLVYLKIIRTTLNVADTTANTIEGTGGIISDTLKFLTYNSMFIYTKITNTTSPNPPSYYQPKNESVSNFQSENIVNDKSIIWFGFLLYIVFAIAMLYFARNYDKKNNHSQHQTDSSSPLPFQADANDEEERDKIVKRCKCLPGCCNNCECAKAGQLCSSINTCRCGGECKNNNRAKENNELSMISTINSNQLYATISPQQPTTTSSVGNILIFVGKPKSGKSFAIKSLLYHYQGYFRFGKCITGTAFLGDYDYIGKENVVDGYDEKQLEEYILSLRRRREGGELIPPNFIIMDDLMGKISIYTPFFTNWIASYRHTNTTIFMSGQALTRTTPTFMRSCADYAFMFRTLGETDIDYLRNYWGGLFMDKKTFSPFFKKSTEQEHSCLVYSRENVRIKDAYAVHISSIVPPYIFDFKHITQQTMVIPVPPTVYHPVIPPTQVTIQKRNGSIKKKRGSNKKS